MTGVRQFSAKQLVARKFPDQKWAVPGVIQEGLTLLIGPPKIGKSWMALDLCVSVAQGGLALDKIKVEKGDVLYLALEDNERRMSSRLKRRLDNGPAPDCLDIQLDWEGTEQVDSWLDEHPRARLVVIDVLARVRGETFSDTSYDKDYKDVLPLKELADRHNVAIVIIHHTRKAKADEDWMDAVSGTNALAGAADAVLLLKRSRGADDARLYLTGRDVEDDEKALSFEPLRGRFALMDGPAGDYDVATEGRRSILTVLKAQGGLGPKDIAEQSGLSPGNVRQLLGRMVKDDQVTKAGRGKYSATGVTTSQP